EDEQIIANHFDKDGEAWQVYDYNGGIAGGGNVFFPVTWEKTGGVNNSGYIWGDDKRWRIDTPDNPHSILAFILNRSWATGKAKPPTTAQTDPLDLRGAEVSVYLRGDDLDLKGAKCYFWALAGGTRWHYKDQPLKIEPGKWGEKLTLTLKNEEK